VIEIERKYLANVRSMGSFLFASVTGVTTTKFAPENGKSLIQDKIWRRDDGTFRKKMKKMMMEVQEESHP
jgi:hypothetical protein